MSEKGKSIFMKKINFWLISLTVLIFILALFTLFNNWAILMSDSKIKIETDNKYINAIILISGFLVAFSAISIYSIFNANVDRERDEIITLKDELRDMKNQIGDKIEEWNKKNKEAVIETERLKKSEEELVDYLNIINSINNLTSPYSMGFKKKGAIQFFSTIKYVPNDVKELILNFYKSLESNEKEKSKPYYHDIKEQLGKWGMIE